MAGPKLGFHSLMSGSHRTVYQTHHITQATGPDDDITKGALPHKKRSALMEI